MKFRVPLAALVALLLAVPAYGFFRSFPDVPDSHPQREAIEGAAALGWFSGYPDGTFRPDASITAAQAARVLERAFEGMRVTRGEVAEMLWGWWEERTAGSYPSLWYGGDSATWFYTHLEMPSPDELIFRWLSIPPRRGYKIKVRPTLGTVHPGCPSVYYDEEGNETDTVVHNGPEVGARGGEVRLRIPDIDWTNVYDPGGRGASPESPHPACLGGEFETVSVGALVRFYKDDRTGDGYSWWPFWFGCFPEERVSGDGHLRWVPQPGAPGWVCEESRLPPSYRLAVDIPPEGPPVVVMNSAGREDLDQRVAIRLEGMGFNASPGGERSPMLNVSVVRYPEGLETEALSLAAVIPGADLEAAALGSLVVEGGLILLLGLDYIE